LLLDTRTEVELPLSKSISNRIAILQALSGRSVTEYALSDAEDTRLLVKALSSSADTLNAGEAGTVMRFLLAYMVSQRRPCTIVCAPAMEKRPIRPLVDALTMIGATITYLGKEGYPPVQIKEVHWKPERVTISLDATLSSQFLSGLLMIGPTLPYGLSIVCSAPIASASYVDLTIACMAAYGVKVIRQNNSFTINAQKYSGLAKMEVEADWSAAGYWYGMAALMPPGTSMHIPGLQQASMQGDSVVASLFESLGVTTTYHTSGVTISKNTFAVPSLQYNFSDCPDLVQATVITCAACGIPIRATGLHTLPYKETHRINALAETLRSMMLDVETDSNTFLNVRGMASWDKQAIWEVYGDHRMAMSLAILAVRQPVTINHPEVVQKSYPSFWTQMERAGFGLSSFDTSGSASGSTKK
jgi:3-phosphoshikimate 1-carboxyvinyltransferase